MQVDLEQRTDAGRATSRFAELRCAARRGVEADLIVVHGISLPPGEFGGPWIDRLFTNALPPDVHPYFAEIGALRVSSHLLVARDGGLDPIRQIHRSRLACGPVQLRRPRACNDFSIGVELEGADTLAYEAAQYEALAGVVAALCRAYPRCRRTGVVGHSDISPGRKTDPGPAFDWPRARALIAAACAQTYARRTGALRENPALGAT